MLTKEQLISHLKERAPVIGLVAAVDDLRDMVKEAERACGIDHAGGGYAFRSCLTRDPVATLPGKQDDKKRRRR